MLRQVVCDRLLVRHQDGDRLVAHLNDVDFAGSLEDNAAHLRVLPHGVWMLAIPLGAYSAAAAERFVPRRRAVFTGKVVRGIELAGEHFLNWLRRLDAKACSARR